MFNIDLQSIEQRLKAGKHTTFDLLTLVEKAIEMQGSAEAFLNTYNESKIREVVWLRKSRKNRKVHKWLMQYLRMRVRIDNSLPIYGKGGVLIIAAK